MRRLAVSLLISLFPLFISGQEDLLNILNKDSIPETNFAAATFKSTRVMNGHSIERDAAGQLDFRISHRFGRLNTGAYEFSSDSISRVPTCHLSMNTLTG
jgi:hypothetical protein